MELKYSFYIGHSIARQSFNRTFMELKYDNTIGIRLKIKTVLIVPLWN